MTAHADREVTWTGDIEWHERAACRGLGTSAELWFILPAGESLKCPSPTRRPQVRDAIDVCWDGCPVRELCWRQAASDPYAEGVWGGEYWPAGWTARQVRVLRGPLDHPDY